MGNKIVVTIALLLAFLVKAQTSGQVSGSIASADGGVSDALYKYAVRSITENRSKTGFYDNSIEGSPYMIDVFSPTEVYYGDEKEGTLFYRYNAYNEEIEIKNDLSEEVVKALNKDKKLKVYVEGKPISFKTYIDKTGRTKNGYLILLRDGTFKLYKRLNITFKEGTKSPNSFVKSVPPRFKKTTEYYIEIKGKNVINHVELKNRKVLGLLDSEKQSNLKVYLKEQNIRIKNEQDITEIIDFLNR